MTTILNNLTAVWQMVEVEGQSFRAADDSLNIHHGPNSLHILP